MEWEDAAIYQFMHCGCHLHYMASVLHGTQGALEHQWKEQMDWSSNLFWCDLQHPRVFLMDRFLFLSQSIPLVAFCRTDLLDNRNGALWRIELLRVSFGGLCLGLWCLALLRQNIEYPSCFGAQRRCCGSGTGRHWTPLRRGDRQDRDVLHGRSAVRCRVPSSEAPHRDVYHQLFRSYNGVASGYGGQSGACFDEEM
ncbi:hypothetical protein CALCODRAFT_160423 [Calocera cornea HHB12733]|uniref:Uncharacterized protein n=1 Tax=Calocera cornea HHB12733 TaxID=1353952 RepID=A0A165CKF6_9BASI|nr:hypothetical protein CALCODRAFT_160423 [Calocera cornea HHB12733]